MADDKKKPSPLEELEKRHLDASAALQRQIDALAADLREAEQMVRELRGKLAAKQQEKINLSFAHDSAVRELEAAAVAEKPKAA